MKPDSGQPEQANFIFLRPIQGINNINPQNASPVSDIHSVLQRDTRKIAEAIHPLEKSWKSLGRIAFQLLVCLICEFIFSFVEILTLYFSMLLGVYGT